MGPSAEGGIMDRSKSSFHSTERARSGILMSAVVTVALWSAAPAYATCLAPLISLSHSSGAPGSTLTVSGRNFAAACAAIGGKVSAQPATGIRIEFLQGSRQWHLATVNANKNLEFVVRVTVPRSAAVGAATIAAGDFSTSRARFLVTGLATTGRGEGALPLIAALLLVSGVAVRRHKLRVRPRLRSSS